MDYNINIVDKMVDTHVDNTLPIIDKKWIIAIVVCSIVIAAFICLIGWIIYRKNLKNRKPKQLNINKVETFSEDYPEQWFKNLIMHTNELTFIEFRNHINNYQRCAGCYILTNKSQSDKVYVGQSKNLAWRVPQHFDDQIKGNARVYRDFNNGDTFTVRLIKWDSSMPNINHLEAGLIRLFKSDSYYGYNRSLGRDNQNTEVIKRRV